MASVKCCTLAKQLSSTGRNLQAIQVASFSTTNRRHESKSYKLVIVGGGSGGTSIAAKFAPKFGKDLAVVEPSEIHYYQPLWTLVGGGIKKYDQSVRKTVDVLPSSVTWYKEQVSAFDPDHNQIRLKNGKTLKYDVLLVALGMQLDYGKVPGLEDALKHDPAVCSNYHNEYVRKTFPAASSIQEGNAIFTFPNTPIKCAGAPQKIMYILEECFRKTGKRERINVLYNTSLPVIFGIPRYAAPLGRIVQERGIKVNYRHNLVEVKHQSREAIFQNLDTGEKKTFEYNLLHVAPPCSAPDVLKNSPLSDETNYLDVNRSTMQHKKYPNVFGIGDCTNAPTAKTAAAVACQSGVVARGITQFMNGCQLSSQYNGYTSCPLVTGRGKCIMAEFGYDGAVLETFPINQAKERYTMYLMKKEMLPFIYWNLLAKGRWNGPGIFRKMMRLGMC